MAVSHAYRGTSAAACSPDPYRVQRLCAEQRPVTAATSLPVASRAPGSSRAPRPANRTPIAEIAFANPARRDQDLESNLNAAKYPAPVTAGGAGPARLHDRDLLLGLICQRDDPAAKSAATRARQPLHTRWPRGH
jgi:hypothetical protein